MEIRDLLPSDREPLKASIESIAAFREEDVAIALELIDDRLDNGEDSDYQFLVAVEGDAALGYVCFGLIPLTVSSFDLYWVVVAPEHQRKGVGARLMTAMAQAVVQQGGRRIYIDTSSSDQYATTRAFYHSQGYAEAARFPDFYRDGEARVVYCRQVGG